MSDFFSTVENTVRTVNTKYLDNSINEENISSATSILTVGAIGGGVKA
jgi:hypothetical protein